MATYYKTVSESIGLEEKSLKSHKIATDGNEDIITMLLSSIWEDLSKVETTWERNEILEDG